MLHACQCDAFDKVPLGKEKGDNDRNSHERRRCHQEPPLGVILELEGLKSERQGFHLFAGEIDQGSHEVIPRSQAGKDDHSEERGFGQGQGDRGKAAEFGCAVYARCIKQVLGQGEEKLSKQEYEKGIAEKCWDNEGIQGVHHPEILEKDEHRDHHHLAWDHEGSHHNIKQKVPIGPVEP